MAQDVFDKLDQQRGKKQPVEQPQPDTQQTAGAAGDVFDKLDTKRKGKGATGSWLPYPTPIAEQPGIPEWQKPFWRFSEAMGATGGEAVGNIVGMFPGKVGEFGREFAQEQGKLKEQSFPGEVAGTYVVWDTGGKAIDLGLGAVSKIPKLAKAAELLKPEKVIKLDEDFLPKVSKKALARNVARTATKQGIKGGLTAGLITGDPYDAFVTAGISAGTAGLFELTRWPFAARLSKKAREGYADWFRLSGPKVKGKASDVLIANQPWNPYAVNVDADAVARGLHWGSMEEAIVKSGRKVEQLGYELDQHYAKLDENARFKLKPLFDDIWSWMGHNGVFNVDGTVKDEAVFKVGLEMMDELTQRLGPEMGDVPPSKLREMRDIFSKRAKSYTETPTGVSVPTTKPLGLQHQRELTHVVENRMRSILNSNSPTLADLNKEYRFWMTYNEVLNAKRIATTGTPIVDTTSGNKIYKGVKVLAGAALGGAGGFEGARKSGMPIEAQAAAGVLGGIGGMVLNNAITSTRWRTLSPVVMNRVAKLLARGEGDAAAVAAAQALANDAKTAIQKGYWQKQAGMAKKIVMEQQMKEEAESAAAFMFQQKQQEAILKQAIKDQQKPKFPVKLPETVAPKPATPAGTGFTPQAAPTFVKEQVAQKTAQSQLTPGSEAYKKQAKQTYKSASTSYQSAYTQQHIQAIKVGDNMLTTTTHPFKMTKTGAMTNDEATAVHWYKQEGVKTYSETGQSYYTLNKKLYQKTPHLLNPQEKKYMKDLISVIDKHRTLEEGMLYRGMHDYKGDIVKKYIRMKAGDTLSLDGFNSFSSNYSTAYNFAGNKYGTEKGVLLHFKAPAGMPAYPYQDFEYEYLLHPGLKFKVVSTNAATKKPAEMLILDLQYLGK